MRLAVKIARILLGFLVVISAQGMLVQGGFSRYARIGIPRQTDWLSIAIGLALLAAGIFLLRPLGPALKLFKRRPVR